MPVISIQRYQGLDEGIALANNTEFGLGGLVFGANTDAAQAAAERMDTDSLGINFFASSHTVPLADVTIRGWAPNTVPRAWPRT